ncbi:hypothetical protein TELCIR_14830 [Teladorsagia circumcincta]|uniref:Reverse transcriptase domain-containing protein n=1 Tax=Teladorsagia circumcincta TaxID=45464 RepID=A0A2G9TZV0_TELCI|nr:hypothetical protein TELCIR_14830 [Teladorsagia circumcincta]
MLNIRIGLVVITQHGLRLNIKKTEYMETVQDVGTIQVNGEDLLKTMCFRYLGSRLRVDGHLDDEIRGRISTAWMRWREITGVICDKRMPIRLKSKWYGHVMGAAPNTVAATVYRFEVNGKRPSGRPRQRWQERSKRT